MEKYFGDDWRLFKEEVKRHYSKYYHTLDWDEHPEDYDDPCFCATCRAYMAEDA